MQQAYKTLEINLFAYCQNDPPNETDSYGDIVQSLLFKIFAGVFCGFFIQFFNDVLNYLIQCIVKGRSETKFGAHISDYISSILSYTLKFVTPFGKSRVISTALSVYLPLAVKYGHKYFSKDKILPLSLAVDILLATLNFLAACFLTASQKSKIRKIRKHSKTKKQVKVQKLLIKESTKLRGKKIDFAFEIGEPAINVILMWISAFKE